MQSTTMIALISFIVLSSIIAAALFTMKEPLTFAEKEQSRLADLDNRLGEATQLRVNAMAQDGCRSRVKQLFAANAKNQIVSAQDIPFQLRFDLELCLSRRIIYAYELSELRGAGLAKFLLPQL